MKPRVAGIRKYTAAYLFVLPCAIVLILMMLSPVIRTFIYSFSKVELPSFRTTWVGTQNIARVFSLPAVPQVLWNTAVWVVGTILFRFSIGFWAALALNSRIKGALLLRTLALLPWTVPSIVAANTWRWMLQSDIGLVNGFLKKWGLDWMAVNWLGSPQTALGSVLAAYTWAGYPFVMIMLLAGMQGISEDLYDAAKIDGTNAAQSFIHITLPSLKNVIVILVILEVISGFNSFDLLYIMTAGGPGGASEILGLFIYRLGFTNFDFAGASAVSTVLIVVAIACFLLYAPVSARRRRA
jgi:multiple sugar transport system permease protein